MTLGGLRLATAALLVAAAFGAGCGDGTDVEIDIRPTFTPGSFLTATPAKTATPGAATRTATPAATATSGATATATATPTAPTPTPTGATPTGPSPTATPGGVSQSVQTTVDDLLPFFTVAGLTTGVSTASGQLAVQAPFQGIGTATQAAVKVDDCPNGGTRTQDDQLTTVTVTLAACKFSNPDLGDFQFDGTITASLLAASAAFNVTVKDLNSNRMTTFVGSVTGTPANGGGFVVNGGPIVLTTPQGKFTLTLDNLTVDGNGNVVSGSGSLSDDDDVFDLQKIALTIRTGGVLADMVATFDDSATASFVVNLKTGSITPAS